MGLLDSIPAELLYEDAPVSPYLWEANRVVIGHNMPSKLRLGVQARLMEQMVETARDEGVTQLLGLCPSAWMCWMRRLGYQTERVGPCLDIGGSANQAIMIKLRPNPRQAKQN